MQRTPLKYNSIQGSLTLTPSNLEEENFLYDLFKVDDFPPQ